MKVKLIEKKLKEYFLNKDKKYININDSSWNNEYLESIYFTNDDRGPYTLNDVQKFHHKINNNLFDINIPEKLWNKKIKIGEYELYIQHNKTINNYSKEIKEAQKIYDIEKLKNFNGNTHMPSVANLRAYYYEQEDWAFILKYHGIYKNLGHVIISERNKFDYNWPEYFGNWFNDRRVGDDKLTMDRNCMMKKQTKLITYNNYIESIDNFINTLDDDIEILDETIPFQSRYSFEMDDKNTIETFTKKEKDYEFFVNLQTKNNIYSPTKDIIDQVFPALYNKIYSKKIRNILINLNIKEIIFKKSVFFDINDYFNLDNIIINAPIEIIRRFKLEKYTDKKNIDKIEKLKSQEKRDTELSIYNDRFDLVFHGKTIKKNISSSKLIEYLENKNTIDESKIIKNSYSHIFQKYPQIKKINIVSFGTYYKYELAGEKHFDDDPQQPHIKKELLEEIKDIYDFYAPTQKYIELKYGFTERGFNMLVIKRAGKGYKLEVIEYDAE